MPLQKIRIDRFALSLVIGLPGIWLGGAFLMERSASAQERQPSDQVCCVSFYGQPVGMMNRQTCQANGGDAAPANRCDEIASADEDIAAQRAPRSQVGISMEEEDDQPTSVVMPGSPAAPQLSISGRSNEGQQICCVSFYGKPVGMMSRQACVEDGGDAASEHRCEGVSLKDEATALERAPAPNLEKNRRLEKDDDRSSVVNPDI